MLCPIYTSPLKGPLHTWAKGRLCLAQAIRPPFKGHFIHEPRVVTMYHVIVRVLDSHPESFGCGPPRWVWCKFQQTCATWAKHDSWIYMYMLVCHHGKLRGFGQLCLAQARRPPLKGHFTNEPRVVTRSLWGFSTLIHSLLDVGLWGGFDADSSKHVPVELRVTREYICICFFATKKNQKVLHGSALPKLDTPP
jgi:hypothetical protein